MRRAPSRRVFPTAAQRRESSRIAAPHALVGLAATAALVLTGAGCEGRSGSVLESRTRDPLTGPAVYELDLARGVGEQASAGLFGPAPGGTHADLVQVLTSVDDDDDRKGVFVRLGGAALPLARADEIGRLLAQLKSRGLPVVCHADSLGHGSLLLTARGCSEVWLSPAGGVESVGLAAQLVFAKGLLDKLGVGVDFLQVGKYKGASEPYTREGPSPEARESLEGTLRDLRRAWIDGIESGRGRELASALEDGPHTPTAAKELGLIDSIGYIDEALEAAKKASNAKRTERGFGGKARASGGFTEILRALSGASAGGGHVAVVRAVGPITMRPSGGLFGGGEGITESGLGRIVRELRDDDDVRAVVLRIDSPGGSALASDLLWHELMKLREDKPLVVSVGGMAASGGYYLACAGNKIYAEPSSIVGSIGVVGGKFAVGEPLAQLGVQTVTIAANPDPARAARSTYMSPFDRWDDATRAKVHASMTGIYDTFLLRIVEGRGLDRALVESSAEGRIFGGATAKERKLVDELGGLDEAMRHALELSGLGEDGEVRLVESSGGLGELFGGGDADGGEGRAEAGAMASRALGVDALGRLALGQLLGEETRTWLESLAPMIQGEAVVASTPFGVWLR